MSTSSINIAVDELLRTLPTLQAKMSLLTKGEPEAHFELLAIASNVSVATIKHWVNGTTKKLPSATIPSVAAYFQVSPESLVVEKPLRKPTKDKTEPTRPHHGTLNYHLDGLELGEAHYVELKPIEGVQEAQSRIWGALSRAPGCMDGKKFETSAHTCVGPTFAAPVRYVIRVERIQ